MSHTIQPMSHTVQPMSDSAKCHTELFLHLKDCLIIN